MLWKGEAESLVRLLKAIAKIRGKITLGCAEEVSFSSAQLGETLQSNLSPKFSSSSAMQVRKEAMKVIDPLVENPALTYWFWLDSADAPLQEAIAPPTSPLSVPAQPSQDLFSPLRQRIDTLEVKDAALAHRICRLIPAQCPFERDLKLFGCTILHIPPLCKLNPLYEEVVGLRFRALCYLADECGEDISQYC